MKNREAEIYDVLCEVFPLFANGNGNGREIEHKKTQYAKYLRRFTAAEVRAVMQYCLLQQNFIPTLHEIKTAIDEITAAATGYYVQSADEALAEVLKKAQSGAPPRFSTPAIESTVKTIGWLNIRCVPAVEVEFLRANWRRVYDTYIRRETNAKAARGVLSSIKQDGERGSLALAIDQLVAKVAALPSAEGTRESP